MASEKDREYARARRALGQSLIDLPCRSCGKPTATKEYKRRHFELKGGITCRKCASDKSGAFLKERHAGRTPQERSALGKKARAKADCSVGVAKQWAGFRADPVKYTSICDAKARRMEDVWKNYSGETKDHIITALVSSRGCTRSGLSDAVRLGMDKAGLTGFESEKVLHGFIPDEINEEQKLIVEVFGDVYHCNPRKFSNPDVFVPVIQRTVGEQWKRDERRLACFYKHGYEVIIIWEYDFRHHPDEQIERIVNAVSKKAKA